MAFLMDEQLAFCRVCWTVTQLLHTVHNFATVVDNNDQVNAVFLDFAKAFDRVLYCKLLHKLKQVLENNFS